MPRSARLPWTQSGLVLPPSGIRAMDTAELSAAYQPIVELRSGRTVAHEALARCTRPEFESPVKLFQQAAMEGACGRLGRWVRDAIFQGTEGHALFVNLHPQELHQRWLVQPTDPIYLHDAPVYLEVTEAAALEHFDTCLDVLNEVCTRSGAILTVDDFGAGYSDMDRVLALRPRVVKLDISLVRDIEQSLERQRYLRDVVRHCHELGAEVVAEGIETMEELITVRTLGADYGQGYLLGRPGSRPHAALWPL